MEPTDPRTLPFLNRAMLDFGSTSQISVQVSLISSLATDFVLRGMTKSGSFQYRFTAVGDGSIETFEYEMTDIPTLIGLYAAEDNNQRPIAHGTLHLAVQGTKVGILAQGLINTVFGITYPISLPPNSQQTEGAFMVPNISKPAAGADMQFFVPNNQVWEIQYLTLKLTASSAVANRTMQFKIQDGLGFFRTYVAGTVQTASQAVTYNFQIGGTTANTVAGTEQSVALPSKCIITPLSTLSTSITNIDTADQLDFPDLWVRVHYIDANQ